MSYYMHEHGGVFCKTGNSGLIGKSFRGEKTWIGPNLVGPKVHTRGGGGCSPWAKARLVVLGYRGTRWASAR